MAQIETAYAAGFFDGEGSVSIVFRDAQLTLLVQVVQKNPEPLKHLKDRWGGTLYRRPAGSTSAGAAYGELYFWSIRSLKASRFLQDISPFLHVKTEAVAKGLEFQATKLTRGTARLLSSEMPNLRLKYREQLMALNRA